MFLVIVKVILHLIIYSLCALILCSCIFFLYCIVIVLKWYIAFGGREGNAFCVVLSWSSVCCVYFLGVVRIIVVVLRL